jgi:hypothetical protein
VKTRYPNVPIKLDPVDSTNYMVDTTTAWSLLMMEDMRMAAAPAQSLLGDIDAHTLRS